MKRLRKFLTLSMGDRVRLISAFVVLSMVRLGLWLLPFRTLLRLLATISQPMSFDWALSIAQPQRQDTAHIIWAVEVSSRYMPGGVKCLARALTAKTLLNWHGYFPDLRIGVARSAADILEAHAWIEYREQVIIGDMADLDRFVSLPSLEGVQR